MKVRENLSTLPFLDQPPLSAFYPLSTEIFETPPPFQSILRNSNPSLYKGGGGARAMEWMLQFYLFLSFKHFLISFKFGHLDFDSVFYISWLMHCTLIVIRICIIISYLKLVSEITISLMYKVWIFLLNHSFFLLLKNIKLALLGVRATIQRLTIFG